MRIIRCMVLPAATAAVLAAAAMAIGSSAMDDPPVITQQNVQIGGRTLKYTAEAGRIAIRDVETGEPHGYIFYTAYRVSSASGVRPVTFAWNGGPGANSSLLHFSVAGPKLIQDRRLVDNPDSWLAASDLVLVDPVGTGFSRPAKAEYASEFYNTIGDVASVTEFIRAWRLLHNAEKAPLFLAGESWGAGRAASVAYALEKRGININGIVLISGGWGLNKEYASQQLLTALRVVDMASTALYYGKTAPDLGKDPAAVRHEAEVWARETYAPALNRIGSLTEKERSEIVTQLCRFTGLSESQIDRESLVISPRQFRTGLLKEQNKQLFVFDMRRTVAPEAGNAPILLDYFRHVLGYRTTLPYIGLEDVSQGFAPNGKYPPSVNQRWNYATVKVTPEEMQAAVQAASVRGDGPPLLGPPLPGTEEALTLNPRMKVLVAAGMYDSFLPCARGAEIERQVPPKLRESLAFKCYIGGHAMYEDAPVRTEFSQDVKALIEVAK